MTLESNGEFFKLGRAGIKKDGEVFWVGYLEQTQVPKAPTLDFSRFANRDEMHELVYWSVLGVTSAAVSFSTTSGDTKLQILGGLLFSTALAAHRHDGLRLLNDLEVAASKVRDNVLDLIASIDSASHH